MRKRRVEPVFWPLDASAMKRSKASPIRDILCDEFFCVTRKTSLTRKFLVVMLEDSEAAAKRHTEELKELERQVDETNRNLDVPNKRLASLHNELVGSVLSLR